MNVVKIAKVCHEVNRAYCSSIGDNSQLSWEEAPEWQRQSAVNGVAFHVSNPNSKPSDSHESWLKEKLDSGWKYGPVKDSVKKEHPCCVPYNELSIAQQSKDFIFLTIVRELEKV